MHTFLRLTLLIAGLGLLLVPRYISPSQAATPIPLLSAHELQQGRVLSRLTHGNTQSAARWARRQVDIASATVGADGRSLDVQFRDGARLAIVAPLTGGTNAVSALKLLRRTAPLSRLHQIPGSSGRAVVLEPFGDELQLGPDVGQPEIEALTQAGFKVDVFRNEQVNVELMKHLSAYSVVYMETHSLYDSINGNAVVAVNDTNNNKYGSLIRDKSLEQVLVSGDPTGTIYLGFSYKFVDQYMAPFPDSSIFFLNGCRILSAGNITTSFQNKNIAAIVGWDEEVYVTANELAAAYTLRYLGEQSTVADAIKKTTDAGLGVSTVCNDGRTSCVTGHLGFVGDGSDTLAKALIAATPTATATPAPTSTPTPGPSPTPLPTASPTSTPVPLFVHLKLAHSSVKVGQTQKAVVRTLPDASVRIVVLFPNHSSKRHTATANRSGVSTWSYREPGGRTRGTNRSARVTATVHDGGVSHHVRKRYVIK